MAEQVVLIDTSILIDYYRKSDKENSAWISLVRQGYTFVISAVSKYEIYCGATPSQTIFWDAIMSAVEIASLDEASIDIAVRVNAGLKRKRKQIDKADLFIASTAIAHNLPVATLNRKHFERIDELDLVEILK